MLDLIASIGVRGLNKVFHVMPMKFNLWLGRCFGGLAYILSGKRRWITYANIKAAFCEEKEPAEIKRIAKRAYINMAQSFAEIVALTKIDKKYIDKYVTMHNYHRIEELSKKTDGVIFLSGHFGNWELNAVTAGIAGFPLYFLGREQKMKKLNELLNIIRESKGNVVIRKGTDIKRIIRVLHEGKIVGMGGDQNAGVNGELVEMFGRPASMAIGPFRIAERTGAYILPAFIHRVKGQYHEIFIEEPMKIGKGDDLIPYMKRFNEIFEAHIRKHPDQWLWMHKRWKVTPLKKVMVLDDGRKGHLKQSLAVVKQLKKRRVYEGVLAEYTPVDIVKVRFKTRVRKTILNAVGPVLTYRVQGRLRLLKWALDAESYKNVSKRYADIIISCGSDLFNVNKILKMENYARNATVFDPGRFNRKRFDLIIIPKHDIKGKIEDDKIVVTELAPNLIEEAEKQRGKEAKKCIGVLIGGDNPDYTFGEELVKTLSDQFKNAAERIDGTFCVTTSRRTPSDADKFFSDGLSPDPRCESFISGNNDTAEDTVENIMKKSDIIIVSGESISMVSEAISSGKPVLVFMPEKKNEKLTKYETFVRRLQDSGFVRMIEPKDIAKETEDLVKKDIKLQVPDDNKKIYDKMHRLF